MIRLDSPALPEEAGGRGGILRGAMPLLPTGKLPADLLQALLDKHARHDPRVFVGPRVGEDAAVIDLGDRYLVATADPITFATDDLGWYALHVNANDIAVRGARPRWFLATLLLPRRATDEERGALFDQLAEACDELERRARRRSHRSHARDSTARSSPARCWARSRRTAGHDRRRAGRRRDRADQGRAARGRGDHRAREGGGAARAAASPAVLVRKARKAFLRAPGISVLPEARDRVRAGRVHAMHDPTEGGIATALHELADAAGVGLRIDRDRITVLPEGAAVRGLRPRPARHASRRARS